MTLNDEIDPKAIQSTINVLRRFSQFDHKMQVSAILTLLEIAEMQRKGEAASVQDIEKKIGLLTGTASRNVYYWADGAAGMTGAHQMVNVGFDPTDRRKRVLTLNAKGLAFIKDVFRFMRFGGSN